MVAIPEKQDFLDFIEVALPFAAGVMIDPSKTSDEKLFACYYDPLRAAIKLKKQGLITESKCNTVISNFKTHYRDTYLPAASYNPSAPFLYTTGLAEDYLENGDTSSKAAISSICTNSGFIISAPTLAKYDDIHYARELAFAMAAIINNYRVGNVTLASIQTKLDAFKADAFTMLDNWQTETGGLTQFYIRPFMVALVTDTLILYHNVFGLSQAEKTEIRDCWEYIHTNLWRSGDTHPSLKFTSVNLATMDPDDPDTEEQAGLVSQNQDAENQDGPGDDVSLMHVAAYAWLFKEGFDGTTWQERADEAFEHGFPHYIYDAGYVGEGDYYHDYGAFVGTIGPNGINAKHVNQQIWTISEFIEWRESVTTEEQETPTASTASIKIITPTGYYGGAAAAGPAYSPFNHVTGGTNQFYVKYSDPTKVLDAGGAAASNAENIATVTLTTGTPTLANSTDGTRPVCSTNVSNSKQAATFNGSKLLNFGSAGALLNGVSKVWFGAVFKLHGIAGNGQFFNCVDSGWNTSRFKPFLSANNPALDGARTSSGATVTASGVLLADETVHAVLWLWDVTAATATIWANDVVTDINGDAFSTAGSIENLNSNAGAPITTGTSLDASVFEIFLHVGSLPDSTQIGAWFDAVKTEYGITAY
jgi:hypothetical protein